MKENPLPNFYYLLLSKRGIQVNILRKFERSVWKTEKKKLDVNFWQRCLDLSVCPEFLKFKHANNLWSSREEVYEFVIKEAFK